MIVSFVLANLNDTYIYNSLSVTCPFFSDDLPLPFALELHGIDHMVLMRALKLLESKGKLKIFKGTSTDDEGVKFSA